MDGFWLDVVVVVVVSDNNDNIVSGPNDNDLIARDHASKSNPVGQCILLQNPTSRACRILFISSIKKIKNNYGTYINNKYI